jgi:hypothetical protein
MMILSRGAQNKALLWRRVALELGVLISARSTVCQ